MPLDPQNLIPDASINRVRIIDLPGVDLSEPEIRGKVAYDLLSSDALAYCIREEASTLGFLQDIAANTSSLLRAFYDSSAAENAAAREAQARIAQRFGQRLAYLLMTLRRGDAVNREARPEWDDSFWAHWAGIGNVIIGGGLISGDFGAQIIAYATEKLVQSSMNDLHLSRADHPRLLPLIGAARSVANETRGAIVLDFGGTLTKRAYATYHKGALQQLQTLPAHVSTWTQSYEFDPTGGVARSVAAQILEVIAETYKLVAQYKGTVDSVALSIATYFVNKQPAPVDRGGIYGQMALLSDNLTDWFLPRMQAKLGQPVDLQILHDGTAAARTFAGKEHTAVIMMGTALGIGFPPDAKEVRPMAAP